MNTTLSPSRSADVERVRSWFPALAGDTVYFENAGGSQVPGCVGDAIRHYMLNTYVQLEAGYAIADRCDEVVNGAHGFIARMVNGEATGKVILGPSTSQLVSMLAGAYRDILEPGDEIIVAAAGHEANIGPWMKLADDGFEVRLWPAGKDGGTGSIADLESLLTERTKIVALVHVSNLLGEIIDVRAVADVAHAAGARVVVDGVAFAPHRAIDVAAWDVDWYVYSAYKVYGPHMAALYGRRDAIAELTGPNHFFVPRRSVPYKFELGGVNHEGCAALLALQPYLRFLAGASDAEPPPDGPDVVPRGVTIDRDTIVGAYETMTALELPLQERLVEYLRSKPAVRIVGPAHAGPDRVPTISFVHETRRSREIVAAAHADNIGIRNGHMYAHRLCESLGIDLEDGVVRVSLVHYNTMDEVDRLIEALDPVL